MQLRKLSLIGFKNVEQAQLEFSPGLNCFVGRNGAGKTNILDALHYLSMGKSLNTTDAQSVRHGNDFFVLDAEYRTGEQKKESILCSFKKGAKKALKRNGKEYEKLSDHIGLVPVVCVSPSDSFLITDAADERRRYLNAFLSQLDREYLSAIVRYSRVLGERNKLLKTDRPAHDMLDILDMQLCDYAVTIHKARTALADRLAPITASFYKELSGDAETVELRYHSELNELTMQEILLRNREKDIVTQHTTGGIHRDDLKMKIGGYALRKYGSQGQQKSFLIALKLAQYTIVTEERNEKPLLLLDDLFDKLDLGRVEKLIGLVGRGGFGQIFITDCNQPRLESILKNSGEPYNLFTVEDGIVSCGTAAIQQL